MEKNTVLSFSRDARFYLDRAEEYRAREDMPSCVRYLRMAAETGSSEARLELARTLTNLSCLQASDRELLRLYQDRALPPTGYYLAGVNAAAEGRYITARAALERFLFFCPYGPEADHAEALLNGMDRQFQVGKAHISTKCELWDRWREAYLSENRKRLKKVPGKQARFLNGILGLMDEQKGTEAFPLLRDTAGQSGQKNLILRLMMIRAATLMHEPVTATAAMLSALPLCQSMTDGLLFCKICLECGRIQDALSMAKAWLSHYPFCAEFLLLAARCCELLPGENMQAKEYHAKAARMDPRAEAHLITKEQQKLRDALLEENHKKRGSIRKKLYHACLLFTSGANPEPVRKAFDNMFSHLTPAMQARLENNPDPWQYAVMLYGLHASGIRRFSLIRTDLSAFSPAIRRRLRQIGKNQL